MLSSIGCSIGDEGAYSSSWNLRRYRPPPPGPRFLSTPVIVWENDGNVSDCSLYTLLTLTVAKRGFYRAANSIFKKLDAPPLRKLSCSSFQVNAYQFLPRDAMHKRGLCRHAVSVCVSVCVSVTFVSCIKTNKVIFEIFSPSGSHTIVVFPHQTEWRYSDGNSPNGGVECRWGRQKTRFWTNIWLRGIQVYSVVNRTSREVWKTSRDERRQPSGTHRCVRCSHKRTTKCLWQTRCQPPPLGHNPHFLMP